MNYPKQSQTPEFPQDAETPILEADGQNRLELIRMIFGEIDHITYVYID
jgi:hypothetical protein